MEIVIEMGGSMGPLYIVPHFSKDLMIVCHTLDRLGPLPIKHTNYWALKEFKPNGVLKY